MREEDENIPKIEWLAKFFQRYKFAGVLAILSVFFAPYAAEWLMNIQKDAINKAIEYRLTDIKQEVVFSRALASKSHMRSLMLSDDFNKLARHRIRSQTLDIVREIKIVWESADRKSVNGKKRLWAKVKNIIYRNSSIYTNELNKYSHPIKGEIGTFIAKTFPLRKSKKREYRPKYSFLHVIYEIVIKDNTSDPDILSENLVEYMKSIHDEYFTDQTKILEKLERKNKI